MAWTGDYLAIVSELMNERPMDDVIKTVTFRNPVWYRVEQKLRMSDFYGEYAKLTIHTKRPLNAAPRVEAGDVRLPGKDEFKEQHITLAQIMSSIGWTQEEAEDAVRTNDAAVANLVEIKIADAPGDVQLKLNLFYNGDRTGRLARVSAYSSQTVTVDNTQANFGMYDGVAGIEVGMRVDIYTVPDIVGTTAWTIRATNVEVTAVNRSTNQFTYATVTGDSSSVDNNNAQDNDFVFVSGSVILDGANKFSAWAGPMGFHGIVDAGGSDGQEFHDGSSNAYNGCWSGKTFQNLDRTLYPVLQSTIARADTWAGGTAGTPATCNLGVIEDYIRYLDEENRAGGGVTVLMMNGATRDWMANKAWSRQNAFVDGNSGKVVPGIVIQQYRTQTGKLVDIVPIWNMPDGVILMGDESDLIHFVKNPIGWYRRNGRVIFDSPGQRNLTHESWLRCRTQLATRRCDRWVRIEDINLLT